MSVLPGAKKQKISKVIGTHDGTFHCDEALAVFFLQQTAAYHNSSVKRSRDPDVLDTCDIVVDVGSVYDEGKQRFDHHQRGFTQVFGHGFVTKLSSAGLVYKHFGREVIANLTQLPLDGEKVTTLWLKIYKEFVEAIDGIDNGISQYPTDIEPKYHSRTDLSSRVGRLNPAWNQQFDSVTLDNQFTKASALTGEEFSERVYYYANAWLPARELVSAALEKTLEVHPSGAIVLFEQFLPWKEHLFELESASVPTKAKVLYVIYPDESSGNWRIQAVPVTSESFISRKALPEVWRGLRDEVLSETCGIRGGVFVHATGFIGGNKSREGALQMAIAALTM